jgi:hypothetical protein
MHVTREMQLALRTRELMLSEREAKAYIAIYLNGGVCPACGFDSERYESKVCTHARRCDATGLRFLK